MTSADDAANWCDLAGQLTPEQSLTIRAHGAVVGADGSVAVTLLKEMRLPHGTISGARCCRWRACVKQNRLAIVAAPPGATRAAKGRAAVGRRCVGSVLQRRHVAGRTKMERRTPRITEAHEELMAADPYST